MFDYELNVPAVITVQSTTTLTTGDVRIFNGGTLLTGVSLTLTNLGTQIWSVTFTPTQTGNYTLVIGTSIIARFRVVTKTIDKALTDLQDAALGSWSWDKNTGVLTLFKITGAVLGTYSMTDTVNVSQRQKLT